MPPQKHIIDSGVTTVASTSQTSLLIAKGVINPDPFTNNYECRAGSIVGALTIQLDVVPDNDLTVGAPAYFDWGLFFNINDAQTAPSMEAAMSSAGADLITQIFHQDGALVPVPGAVSNTSDNQVKSWRLQVKVPTSWQKVNRGDTIRLYFKFNQSRTHYVKIKVIYKEYWP